MKNQRKVSFASASLSSTPSFEPRNLPILQTKCQTHLKPTKAVPDSMSLPSPMKVNPNVPPPTPLHPLRQKDDLSHKCKASPDLLALSQMFEQMQSSGQARMADRRISQSMTDLPERSTSIQYKPRKLEPLVAREKIIIQEQNGPAGLHLAVNYSPGDWRDPLGRGGALQSDNKDRNKL